MMTDFYGMIDLIYSIDIHQQYVAVIIMMSQNECRLVPPPTPMINILQTMERWVGSLLKDSAQQQVPGNEAYISTNMFTSQ